MSGEVCLVSLRWVSFWPTRVAFQKSLKLQCLVCRSSSAFHVALMSSCATNRVANRDGYILYMEENEYRGVDKFGCISTRKCGCTFVCYFTSAKSLVLNLRLHKILDEYGVKSHTSAVTQKISNRFCPPLFFCLLIFV